MVEHSRRQLWVALVLVLVLGSAALMLLAFPGKTSGAGWYLMILYPEILAGALLSLRKSKRQLAGVTAARLHAVVDDELRRHSLGMAWRNGFFVMLLAQPVLGLLVTWSGTPYPVALLAGASSLAGVATALASVLYYDR
ncbi:MAG: hypothetical protein ACXWC4_07190 [Telluria sp.]